MKVILFRANSGEMKRIHGLFKQIQGDKAQNAEIGAFYDPSH